MTPELAFERSKARLMPKLQGLMHEEFAKCSDATQQDAEQASGGQVSENESDWERRFDSLADEVYRIAGHGDFHHPWDAIGGIERQLAEAEELRKAHIATINEAGAFLERIMTEHRKELAETRGIAGELIDYVCHQEHCSIGGTPHCICALETLLDRAEAAGISPEELRKSIQSGLE